MNAPDATGRDELGRLIDSTAFNPFSSVAHTESVREAVLRILASEWFNARLAEAERRGEEKALLDAADAIQALHPGEVKNSVAWLRDRAAQAGGET